MKTNRQLRLKLDKIRGGVSGKSLVELRETLEHVIKIYGIELDAANAEVARLRKALRQFAGEYPHVEKLLENRTGCKPVLKNVSQQPTTRRQLK